MHVPFQYTPFGSCAMNLRDVHPLGIYNVANSRRKGYGPAEIRQREEESLIGTSILCEYGMQTSLSIPLTQQIASCRHARNFGKR